jgi:hypothetical protein
MLAQNKRPNTMKGSMASGVLGGSLGDAKNKPTV